MNNLYRSNVKHTKNRGTKAPHSNNTNLKNIKNNTIRSLNEVEYFLNNISHVFKYLKIYNLLKKN